MLGRLSKMFYNGKLKEKITQFLAASILFTGAYSQLNATPIKEIAKDIPQVQQVEIKKENYSSSNKQQTKVNNKVDLEDLAPSVKIVDIPKTTNEKQKEVYSSSSKSSNPIQDIYNSVSAQTKVNKAPVQQQKIESSLHKEVKPISYSHYLYEVSFGDKAFGVIGKGDNVKPGTYYTSAFGKGRTITASYSLGMEEIDSSVIKLDRIKVNVYGAKFIDKNHNGKIDKNDLIAVDLNNDGKFEKNEYFKVKEESHFFGLIKHPYIEVNGKKVKLEEKIASSNNNYKGILVSNEEGKLVAYERTKGGLEKVLSANMNGVNLIAQEGKPSWEVFKTDKYGKVTGLNFSQWDYNSAKDKEEINNLANGNTYDVGKLAFWHPNEVVGIEVKKAGTLKVPKEIYEFIEDNTNIVFQYFANLEKEAKTLEKKIKVINSYETKKPIAEAGSYLAGNLVGSLAATGAATVHPAVALVTAGKFIVDSYQAVVKNNMVKGVFTSYDEFMRINSMNEKQLKEYYNNDLIAKAALAAGAGIFTGVVTSSTSGGSYTPSNTNQVPTSTPTPTPVPTPNPTSNPVTPYTP